jgi:hypothetical protein
MTTQPAKWPPRSEVYTDHGNQYCDKLSSLLRWLWPRSCGSTSP